MTEPLLDFGNVQYAGVVELGTPPQQQRLIMDTGSSDLWVKPSSYSLANSSTARRLPGVAAITYGKGSVEGGLVADDLRLAGILLKSQGLMLPSSVRDLDGIAADGVLGLAQPGIGQTGETVLQHLGRAAGLTRFALFLTDTEDGSSLVLGSPDESWYDPSTLVWANEQSGLWWQLEATVSVGGRSLHKGGFIVDSGTSFIGVPSELFAPLVESVLQGPPQEFCQLSRWGVYACDSQVLSRAQGIEVVVSGRSFPVSVSQLFAQLDTAGSGQQCFLQIFQTPIAILGDTFLRTVGAIFDVKGPEGPRIGLALRPVSFSEWVARWRRTLLAGIGLLWVALVISEVRRWRKSRRAEAPVQTEYSQM